MKSLHFIALSVMGVCLLLMSFASRHSDDENILKYKYLYLKTTCKNIDGDVHAYSRVFKVRANSERVMSNEIQDLIFAFEDELYDHFPNAYFVASHNWVAGTFSEEVNAEVRRNQAMSFDGNSVEILLNGGVVNY